MPNNLLPIACELLKWHCPLWRMLDWVLGQKKSKSNIIGSWQSHFTKSTMLEWTGTSPPKKKSNLAGWSQFGLNVPPQSCLCFCSMVVFVSCDCLIITVKGSSLVNCLHPPSITKPVLHQQINVRPPLVAFSAICLPATLPCYKRWRLLIM